MAQVARLREEVPSAASHYTGEPALMSKEDERPMIEFMNGSIFSLSQRIA